LTHMYHVLCDSHYLFVSFTQLFCYYMSSSILPAVVHLPFVLRAKLRELALSLGTRNVQVLATYGFTEAKQAWTECPFAEGQPSPGYHLYPDLGIIEVVDPKTGEPLPPGEPDEIVFTPLDARGSVVLRYRPGVFTD